MTTVKRILAVVLVVVMVMALSVTAFASPAKATITITPTNQAESGSADRFTAYQIFKGTVEADKLGDTDDEQGRRLSHITWGDDIDHAKLMEEIAKDPTFTSHQYTDDYAQWEASKDEATDAEFLAYYLDAHGNDEVVDAFVRIVGDKSKSIITGTGTKSQKSGDNWTIQVDPGYYLIIDTVDGTGSEAVSASSYILEVAKDRTVEMKATMPTVQKNITESDKGILEATGEDNDITYVLTGTVAKNIADYDTYSYEFKDTIPVGLTADEASVTVEIDGRNVTDKKDTAFTVTLTKNTDAVNTLTVSFTDLKSTDLAPVSGTSTVKITYTAYLNKNAVVGETGNTNSVELTYSNDPYGEGKGKTVPATAVAYTLGLDIAKLDGSQRDETLLAGAKFKLKNEAGNFAVLEKVTSGSDEYYAITKWDTEEEATVLIESVADKHVFVHGLDVGTYTMVETETPAGYELMHDVQFTIAGGDIEAGPVLGNVTATLADGHDSREDAEVSINADDGGVIDVKLINYEAPVLPHTGGIGAGIVLAISALVVLAGASIIVFAVRKDRKAKQQQ